MDFANHIFLILQLLFIAGNVVAADQSKEGVLYPHKGHSLLNHVIMMLTVPDVIECGMQCTQTSSCKSVNYQHASNDKLKHKCELNNKNRRSASDEDYRTNSSGFTYYEKDLCVPSPCSFAGTCSMVGSNDGFQCRCLSGYKGRLCESERLGWFPRNPAKSCKDIVANGDALHDGKYWINPENSEIPFIVYCDMKTEAGGWLLVSNVVIPSPAVSPSLSLSSSYRDIANYNNNNTLVSATALRELRQHMPFTQLRFHCRKAAVGRTVDIITAPNSTGFAVVDYFTAQTDTLPMACQSFYRGPGDTSMLAVECARWGNDGQQYVGKWGHHTKKNEWRMYNHALFVANAYHWIVYSSLFKCDDRTNPQSYGDFWKVYVR